MQELELNQGIIIFVSLIFSLYLLDKIRLSKSEGIRDAAISYKTY